MHGGHRNAIRIVSDGLGGSLGGAAHLCNLARSRRNLVVPDCQNPVRCAEMTCSTTVGSGDHAGTVTVRGMQGGPGVSITTELQPEMSDQLAVKLSGPTHG